MDSTTQTRPFYANPWTQLVIGVTCMVMIANLQYGWTFFVPDIQKKFGWDRAAIQIAFTLFVLFETWLVPIEGWFVDRFGPRLVILLCGVLVAIGWIINSRADTLTLFYLAQIIAGIGAGGVYGTCIGNALKWFPSRRGLAAGITAAGFGAGAAAFAGAAAGAATAFPSVSIVAITSPAFTVPPSPLTIFASTPSAGAGSSSTTLSVSMSIRFSSRFTASPTFLCQASRVASATDSDSCGTLTSMSMSYFLPVPWTGRTRLSASGLNAASTSSFCCSLCSDW